MGKKDEKEKKGKKSRKIDYFEMMSELVSYSTRAAEKMNDCLAAFRLENLNAQRAEIHEIEHQADEARHQMLGHLVREFMTPIERDDILQLVQIIDDVTDAIDEVVINLYIFGIRQLPAPAVRLAELVLGCTRALEAAIHELRNFKKSDILNTLLIDINRIESEADEVHVEAMRELFSSGRPALEVVSMREVYDGLEHCCDLCEHAADVVENTVMRNT